MSKEKRIDENSNFVRIWAQIPKRTYDRLQERIRKYGLEMTMNEIMRTSIDLFIKLCDGYVNKNLKNEKANENNEKGENKENA